MRYDSTPAHGYLADDFARFRTARLNESGRAPVDEAPIEHAPLDPADEPSESETDFDRWVRQTRELERPMAEPVQQPECGLFFGTSSSERRQIRAKAHGCDEERGVKKVPTTRRVEKTERMKKEISPSTDRARRPSGRAAIGRGWA